MSKKIEIRNYKVADADLKQLADGLALTITRDLTDFATRNITAANVTALNTLIDTFDTTTTDEELHGLVSAAAEVKDGITENIRKAIRPIRNMAEMVYNGRGKYATFGFDEMARLSDNELYRLARRVVRVGNTLLTELATQGLTAANLTALNNLANQLDAAIDSVGTAVETRDLETQDRIAKGNALWAEMARLASIGKSLYEDTNEAKYNDYVLIGSSPVNNNTAPPNA